ncbi:MAG TPA: IPT/TIG domain-containing protein, partial [Niastella sp.]
MRNVYLALKRSVGIILLLISFVAQSKGNTSFIADTTAPAISTFSPTSGQKGTFVTIFGSNFVSATAVRFGGVLADSIVFKNDTVIVAIVDTGATGNVSVTTPYGAASKPGFTFIRDTTNLPDTTVPVIVSFSPVRGKKGTGVTIYGSHFTGASAVRFGGVLAASVTVTSDNFIYAVVGTGATGNVSVTTPHGIATKPGFT